MSGSYEKSVKGGTKIKLAAPKSKYVEHILQATHAGEAGVAEIFRTLHGRLRDSTWTIVFKGLIITHLMIREGQPKTTLRYLADSPSKMAISNFTDVQVQGENIRCYYKYLLSKVKAYATTQVDWVLEGKGRLHKQTIDKGLLRETETVQAQISSLLKCDLFSKEMENEITLTAFRLLTMDLLALYHSSNEGAINVLEHYFEMSKPDAERALTIYRTFAKQTDQVVAFLSVARQYEGATRLEIPKLKHAPTGLASSLEEYLHDPDFEINRRQYMAQKEAKRTGQASSSKALSSDASKPNVNGATKSIPAAQPQSQQPPPPQSLPQAKGPAPDLIDFFESIEQNQQPMMASPPAQMMNGQGVQQFGQQPTGFMGQMPQAVTYDSTNPFANMMQPAQQQANIQQQAQSSFASAQMPSLPQNTMQTFQQQPLANPQQQSPFATGQQLFAQQQQQQSLQQFNTGTQPFFNPTQQSSIPAFQPLSSAQTGTTETNPFRASMMPQQTGANNQSMFLPQQSSPTQQPLNPFRSATMPLALTGGTSPFNNSAPASATSSFFSTVQSPQSVQSFQSMPTSPPMQQPMQTGTNPFKSVPPSTFHTPMTSPLAPQQTGTNPFRQSTFTNQQTGQGWQANQGTMGGLEHLPSIPVFPRPVNQPGQ